MDILKVYFLLFFLLVFSGCEERNQKELPNIIVSTDIGGSDPDDYQSMVHLLLYADQFNIKGLISSPPHQGRKKHIEEVIYAYEKDYKNLIKHSTNFPTAEYLLAHTKQGSTEPQSTLKPEKISKGSKWIIEKAKEDDLRPLYILVWGSITDVAEAVHFDPTIKKNIRIYSIGSWNTVQDSLSRNYLYNLHPDLWWIENNTTFRGMYMGGFNEGTYENLSFVETHIKNHGELGKLFWEKKKDIKMGDTPSVLYLLNGNINNPEGESWGGSFVKTAHGLNFWTDNQTDSLVVNGKAGAKTINKFRKEFLNDWANRMKWLKE